MSIDQEGRRRRQSELANRPGEDHIRRESTNQEFLKFMKMSEECEINREILEALVYWDIGEEVNAVLKRFEIL